MGAELIRDLGIPEKNQKKGLLMMVYATNSRIDRVVGPAVDGYRLPGLGGGNGTAVA